MKEENRNAVVEWVTAPISGSEPRQDGSNSQWCSVTPGRAFGFKFPSNKPPEDLLICGDP